MTSSSNEEYFYKLDKMIIRSIHFLRQIFKQRWKVETGEDWIDDDDHIKDFLSHHSESLVEKAMTLQKKILFASRSLEDWDISLMSLVLLNFGDGNTYKLQNQAIRQLKDLRNALAHHKTKKCRQSEYCDKLKLFKESLRMLEVKENEIKRLVKDSSVSLSLDDTERLKMLLKNADQLMELQDFESALVQYSEAIAIPRLSAENLGMVYEKRASCYLSIKNGQHIDEKHMAQAMLDVKQAIKLNKSSWNAHYLKAQCHKAQNNLSEAIRFYEMALAISPVQKQVKQDWDSCKLLDSKQKTNANLNLDQLPVGPTEIVGQFEDESMSQLTLTEVAELYGFQKSPVFLGEQYYYGLEVPQDYAKAIKYYIQADKEGYTEGCFKLGLCYHHGHGVKQDVSKSVKIFKRCAAMDAKKKSLLETHSPLGFNMGVAHAESSIGKCYENGTGVEKNLADAVTWYTRAMEHGEKDAASYLGIFYYNGQSLPKDEKMAEMCWKQGLNLGSTYSAELLVEYYRRELEPEMAWIMFETGREMGHSKFLEMSDDQFNRDLTLVQSERCRLEKHVLTFEKDKDFGFKGMTFRERALRAEKHLSPNYVQMYNCRKNNDCGGQIQRVGKDVVMEVGLKSIHGSKTAKLVFQTINTIFELNLLLTVQTNNNKAYKMKVVHLFYECMLLEDHLKILVTNIHKFQNIVAELFNETCQQKSEAGMKIRLCYVGYNLWSSLMSSNDLYAFGILQEGLRRYPDNYGYHRLLIYSQQGRNSYESALEYVNKALLKFPNKVCLRFLKADILLRCEKRESSNLISAFKLFLDNAPLDHRLVPEAYYTICLVHMGDYMKDQVKDPKYFNNGKIKLIRDNFQRGKDAENDQLPCYQPYGISDFQLAVKGFLGANEQKCKRESSLNHNTEIPMVSQFQSVLKSKEYLKSPVRKGLILQHRERLRDVVGLTQNCLPYDDEVVSSKLQQRKATLMFNFDSITLQEMNPTRDNIFENRIIDLTIIDDPNVYSNSIQLVAEDDNGDTTRVYVDFDGSERIHLQRFEAGCRLAIINPYMGILSKTKMNGIRINEPKCIMYLEKAIDLCRFCGEENATRKCSKCKRLYCSRECQKLDWEIFQHKLICSLVYIRHVVLKDI